VLRRTFAGALAAAAMALPVTVVVSAPTAAAAEIMATTLTYDDTQAAEFKTPVADAVRIWNASVSNVQIRKAAAGQRANIRILADEGWPRATLGPIYSTGRTGTVWMGREAVRLGHDPIRIAAHELGHNLGLPDIKPGPCSSLMSGADGGIGCTNAKPNASEAARVQRSYAGTVKTQQSDIGVVISEAAY
jgi:snapalysin